MTLVIKELEREVIPEFELRTADTLECLAGGLSSRQAVEQSVDIALASFVALEGDIPVVFWGYRPISILGNICFTWMLSTPLAERHKFFVARESRTFTARMLARYPILSCQVWQGHEQSIKWLEWLGYNILTVSGEFYEMRAYRKGYNRWAS